MIPTTKGEITVDGQDIATLSPTMIRRGINVIPQDPVILPGSLKFNLDPHKQVSEEVLQDALTKVGLEELVARTCNGDLEVEPDLSAWSQGEQQLLEVARALLIKSSIMVLDEATSK